MSKISIDFKTGLLKNDKPIYAGIDLGTTNSLIARMNEDSAEIIEDVNHEILFIPSIIHIHPNYQIEVGKKAKQYLVSDPTNTIYSIKRLLGKSYADLTDKKNNFGYHLHDDQSENLIKVKIRDKYFTPIELSSYILTHLKIQAEQSLKSNIENVVITVPAYFNDNQRQATRDAGKLAGLNVLRIINEPTAACLAYGIGLNRNETKHIAVYDLGGGTFDISILRVEDGIFEVLSTRGDTYLGGDDFDNSIVKFWQENFLKAESNFTNELRILAEKAKISVNDGQEFIAHYNHHTLSLNQSEFKKISIPLIQKTITCCERALADSALTLSDIDEVLLVGGSTRLNIIRQAVKEFFTKEPNTSLNPDHAVALGAAIQADILAGNRKDLLLLDVNPLSLGIETLGGLMDVIIPRNSKIPVQLAREYTTSKDGQINLRISVYQGERDLVENNRKLGEFTLSGIPPMPAGIPKIQVRFYVDADGILKVKARELRTNTEQEVTIKSQFSLSADVIAKMLMESVHFAKQDIEKKSLVDTINEANSLVLASQKFIKDNQNILSENETSKLKNLSVNLQKSIESSIKDEIQKSIEELNEYSTPIAHKVMDLNIQKALSNQTIVTTIAKELKKDGQET
ncbi:MAG: Fe-S protein assembly chaperone HscA [Saprospiraceae bacterium]|nr:Fe-S protein assembly chaperone HscA [Saprospiraceae bacterium]